MDRAYPRVILGCGNFGGIGSAPAFFGQGETLEQAFDLMDAAWDSDITWFDTADAYGPGDELGAGAQGANERLIVSLLDELGVRDRVVLATKGGHVRTEGGGWDTDSSAAHLRAAVDASLERLDLRLVEAGGDLYAGAAQTFRHVTLPLSLPGVVSGTLLTFIPAAGDYVNVQFLGNPGSQMIGNVIQSRFLTVLDYPVAAALSITVMTTVLVLVLVYVRRVGARELL